MAFISGNFRPSRAVIAQVRVRQYEKAGAGEYYPLLDWREVEGSGEQELQLPIDRERVASGGRTYVEWRFARRGGGKFDEQSLVSLEALAVDRTRWGWYTRTVMSCEQEDTYRYGFNGQEKVNEISGTGNHNTALFWEYDTRLGRRWNLDPVDQISISNYAANRNNPIWFNDPLGNDPIGTVMKNGHQAGMPGSGTTADLEEVKIGGKKSQPTMEQRIGKLYEPIIKMGEAIQSWGDRKWRVSNEEWYGGKSWEGDGGFRKHGWPTMKATAAVFGGAVALPMAVEMGVGALVKQILIPSLRMSMGARATAGGIDLTSQYISRQGDWTQINPASTLGAMVSGSPLWSTVPGAFMDFSTGAVFRKERPILQNPTDAGVYKTILINTSFNVLGGRLTANPNGARMPGMHAVGSGAVDVVTGVTADAVDDATNRKP